MESAKIIQEDTPEQIVLNPATEYVEKFVAHTNPLNVLRGDSLMTPLSEFTSTDDKVTIDNDLTLVLDNDVFVSVQSAAEELPTVRWTPDLPITQTTENTIFIVPANIAMRDAVEIRYHSKQMMILEEKGKCVGIINDHNFYHALLGKHFGREAETA